MDEWMEFKTNQIDKKVIVFFLYYKPYSLLVAQDLSQHMRKGYFSYKQPAKTQASLRINTISPRPFAICRHVADIFRKLQAKTHVCSLNNGLLLPFEEPQTVKSCYLFSCAGSFVFLLFQVINKILYSGSSDHTGRAWVTEFGDCTRIYKGHKHTVSVIKMKDGLGTYLNALFKGNRSFRPWKRVFEHMRTAKAKISLRMRAVFHVPCLSIYSCIVYHCIKSSAARY